MFKGLFSPVEDFGEHLVPVLVLTASFVGRFLFNTLHFTFNLVFIFVAIIVDIPVTSTKSFSLGKGKFQRTRTF